MPINYSNLDFGSQGLRNLTTVGFTASFITASNGFGDPGLKLEYNTNYSYLKANGYYQIFPSRSANNFDSLLPLKEGDIITFDSGTFGTLEGSITKKITSVFSSSPPFGILNNIFLGLDSELTGSYNSASWVINRRVETENYIMLELPYSSFGISLTGSSDENKITGFLLPENYNPDLIYRLDEIAGKAGLGPMTTSTGSNSIGGGRFNR